MKNRTIRLSCSCGAKVRYQGSQPFCEAVRATFKTDHRGHRVTEAGAGKRERAAAR